MPQIIDLDDYVLPVRDGMRVGLGGFWFVRNPTALVDRLIASGARDLEVVMFGGGLGIERLLASGQVRRLWFCFHSMDVFGLAPNFRAAAESGTVEMVELTTLMLHKALEAHHDNVPSLPILGPLGSAFLEDSWPVVPYDDPVTGQRVHAVEAMRLDLALIHGQRADRAGNVCVSGGMALDRQLATAADHLVVSVEEIVEDFTGERAHLTTFSAFQVDDVVVAPGGAYPGSCLPYYATDYVAIDGLLDGTTEAAAAPLPVDQGLSRARELAERGLVVDVPASPSDLAVGAPPTPAEVMVATLASLLRDQQVYTVGSVTPLSMAAYQLAKRTHAPGLVLIPFAGLVDVEPYPAGIQTAETFAFRYAHDFYGIDDLHSWIYLRGAIDGEIFTPGQIDQWGNINNSRIGTGSRPDVRLPGQAGIADVTVLHKNLYMYVARHEPRRFPAGVDFRGGQRALVTPEEREAARLRPGEVVVVTNLCVFRLDQVGRRLVVDSLHPGVTLDDVQRNTGWEVLTREGAGETPVPTASDVDVIRGTVDPWGLRELEFVSNRERRPLIRRVLRAEYDLLGVPYPGR